MIYLVQINICIIIQLSDIELFDPYFLFDFFVLLQESMAGQRRFMKYYSTTSLQGLQVKAKPLLSLTSSGQIFCALLVLFVYPNGIPGKYFYFHNFTHSGSGCSNHN